VRYKTILPETRTQARISKYGRRLTEDFIRYSHGIRPERTALNGGYVKQVPRDRVTCSEPANNIV